MDGATDQARRATAGRSGAVTGRPAPWHALAVLVALMLAAFTFNTAENLPPRVMAGLRNLAVGIHRQDGRTNIAAALRRTSRRLRPRTALGLALRNRTKDHFSKALVPCPSSP
ncbi:hypothetical protein [Streptomyces sp. NPDC000134]|uniref:hypothetical protein n=1 Tax=Streptomyces sp. NPDC000134 TaxID=3364536 RepID=UPI00367D4B14